MRFYHHPRPLDGTRRQRRFFAFLPITIGSETRWLEFVTVEEEFREGQSPYSDDEWRRKRFIDPGSIVADNKQP